MGIETTPDVEESTEPPICPCPDPISHAAPTTLNSESCDPKEKPEKLVVSPATHSLPANLEQREFTGTTEGKEHFLKNAHLLEPNQLTTLLETDLQYVEVIIH